MPKTVCVFGDSVAKGVIFDTLKNKHLLLKNCFVNLVQGETGLCVKNYAKYGCTVEKGKEILEKHTAELSQYDYVVFEFGGNDCDFDWTSVSATPDAQHFPNTTVERFEQVYSEMIAEVKSNGGVPILLSLPPIDAQKYFSWISKGLNEQNILRFLGDREHIYRWHEMYNLAVYRLGLSQRVPVLDISSRFLSRTDYRELLCGDGIHPSEKGHQLIAEELEAYISRVSFGAYPTLAVI